VRAPGGSFPRLRNKAGQKQRRRRRRVSCMNKSGNSGNEAVFRQQERKKQEERRDWRIVGIYSESPLSVSQIHSTRPVRYPPVFVSGLNAMNADGASLGVTPVVNTPGSMSVPSPGDGSTPSLSEVRVLSCTRCQKRKIKCDRTFPCTRCRKVGTHYCLAPTHLDMFPPSLSGSGGQ
jgi:hypothetical protein